MARLLKHYLRFWVRSFWGVVLFAIITLAVVVQLGRALFPVLNDYREFAEEHLSAQLGVEVQVGGIQAEWKGLRPRLTLTDVAVHNSGAPVFSMDRINAEISLLSTLRDWRLAFRRLSFNGLTATLIQNAEGQWWVRGLDRAVPPVGQDPVSDSSLPETADLPEAPPSAAAQRDALKDPLNIFLFGRRLELNDTRLEFVFRSGLVTHAEIPQIRMENDSDFHRLSARFSLDQDPLSLYLVVEGRGDPRDQANFDAQGYLQLRQFPSEKVLAAFGFASDLLLTTPDPLQQAWRDDGRVTLDLWFRGTSTRGVHWQGNLDMRGSPLQPPPGVRWPESVGANFSGTWLPRDGWQLQLTDTRLWWPELTAPPLDLQVSGQLVGETRLALATLDIGQWSQLLLDIGAAQGESRKILETLRPQGRLFNLEVRERPTDQGRFALRAQIEDGSVEAWAGAPAVQGINGFVNVNALGGEVHLQSNAGFSLFFPRIYHQPLAFQEAQGTVRWALDKESRSIGISSGTVRLANADVTATGHFDLNLPLNANDQESEPEMTLVIGAERGAASLHRLLVPYTVPQQLYEWLGRSIEAGELRQVGFIYHGSLLKEPRQTGKVIQLRAQVADAQVAFDPKWPPLQSASGLLYLDDNALQVRNLRGLLGEVKVMDGQVTLERPSLDDQALRVRGQLTATGGQARALLDQSPLRDLGGSEVASWRWSGGVEADVDVLVPLSNGVAGAQRVDVVFNDARLTMPNLDLEFDGIHGPLSYDSARGLSSPGFDARLWGQDLRMALNSRGDADHRLLVGDFTGSVDMARLRTWAERSELDFAHGATPVAGRITVPMSGEGELRLALDSSLEGVRVEVPGLFNKAADQPAPLSLVIRSSEVDGGGRQQRYLFDLLDRGQLLVLNRNGRMLSADLAVGESAQPAAAGTFRIHGQVEQLDALAWGTLLSRFAQASTQPASPNAPPPMDVELNLRIGNLKVADWMLEDFDLSGSGRGAEWNLSLEQSRIAGTVQLVPGQPLRLDLSRLHLPGPAPVVSPGPDALPPPQHVGPPQPTDSGQVVPSTPDIWDQVVFASVPSVDFQVRDLRHGDRALGDWSAKVRPTANGLLAYDLRAEAFDLKVAGQDTGGAELVWLRTPQGHTTYFSGVVEARNLAESFRQLGIAPVLSSEKARFNLDLQWPTSPSKITLEQTLGVVDLDVARGLFARSGSVGENPLIKLIGLLNFDTLARRLRLDFSDLTASGLGYETIHGSLLFDGGVIRIQEPLQVATPSSDLQLVGDLNALNQTLDAQLVATLPLAGNLTVAAAITGGVPLAVGVFLAGKLFKNQVERVSSLRYQVSGTWDDPEVRLERIFESRVPGAPGGENAR